MTTPTEQRIHELANYTAKQHTDGVIPSEQAHHIITELTLILNAVRFAERDHQRALVGCTCGYAQSEPPTADSPQDYTSSDHG